MSESIYIHGTAPEEQERLSRLNDLINAGSLREIGLQGGERILDLGSGLGQFSRAMARISRLPVIGIEYSMEQLQQAERLADAAGEKNLVEFRQGDATDPPLQPYEWGAFDVAHTRFLLEHLKDPLAAVRMMVRAVRQGGRIVLEDDDHDVLRLWPEPPGFESIWRAYMRTYERIGNDPIIGRRLVNLLHQAGAQPVRNTWVFFGSCSGHPDFEAYVENIASILEGARSGILAAGGLDDSTFESTVQALREWRKSKNAAIWFAICWAEGRK